jgi:hypothetical protein
MQQQISVITLGIAELGRSKRFYAEGFGWTPTFETSEIAFYQMNGFILGTWLQGALEADMQRGALSRPGSFALAHNVASEGDVQILLDRLAAAGGPHPAGRGRAAPWRLPRLCRRPRRSRLGNRLEPGMGHRCPGIGDLRSLTGSAVSDRLGADVR